MIRLQSLDLDARADASALHYRMLQGDLVAPAATGALGDGIRIAAKAAVSFDGYFNAFFDSYWFGFTTVASVTLQVEVDGDCVVSLWRQSPGHRRQRVDQATAVGHETISLSAGRAAAVEPGRIWFEVEAAGETAVLTGGWFTNDQPVRDVALGVVFCTFNRQSYLRRIMTDLDADPVALDRVARIVVVNQGERFEAAAIVGPEPSGDLLERLTILEQENLGGCGGFTRGMHEVLVDAALTHFVVLDDDIEMHTDSLLRMTRFFAYADDNVAIGGHMLNLRRPAELFEAGAELDPATLQPLPVNHGLRLGETGGLEPLLRRRVVDYNGWWMFGAPKSVLTDVGYPMPCFIRGDDIEYGMRLARAGVATIAVPGIAVWHEPFNSKAGEWQLFFEVRNRLAMAAVHDAGSWPALRRDLRNVFIREITLSRYHSAQLLINAVAAYVAGPEVAVSTTNEALLAAQHVVRELGPEQVTPPERQHPVMYASIDAPTGLKRRLNHAAVLRHAVRRLLTAPKSTSEPQVPMSQVRAHELAGHDGYLAVDESRLIAWRYTRNRSVERRLWREFGSLYKQIDADDRYRQASEASRQWIDEWTARFRLT